MASLLEELKRRNVIRVAVGYLVLAWVVLQITEILAPALLLPEWTLSFVALIGIVGFPFALFFAWIYELTPEGLKRSGEVAPDDSITSQTASKLNKATTALLMMAVVLLVLDRQLGLSGSWTAPAPTVESKVAEVATAGADPAPAVEPAEVQPRSIAVLPFVNMSNDPDQEYFSDGISEELLNALAKIRELRVAARTSSFAFKGKNQDITEIGEQLKVGTVLEGSVRKAGQRVRITAQLINVADGYHLWSETYDRELVDIFAVQDEISAAIVDALKVHLTEGERVAPRRQVDVQAYNLVLQARHNVRKRTKEDLELAVSEYRRALELDEAYAEAWAGLAIATSLLREDQYGDIPGDESYRMAQSYLDQAFMLDADLPSAHAGQALVYLERERPEKGLRAVNRALELSPSEGVLYLWKSFLQDQLGDYDGATQTLEKAYSVDPLHPSIQISWIARLADNGRGDEAGKLVTPGSYNYYRSQWFIARAEGRWADQIRILDEAAQHDFNETQRTWLDRTRFYTLYFELYHADIPWEHADQHDIQLHLAILQPEAAIEALQGKGFVELGKNSQHVLVDALVGLQRCEEVIELLASLHLEDRALYAIPVEGHDENSYAIRLAWCLQQVGEQERAGALADKLMALIELAMEKGTPVHYPDVDLATLELARGDRQAALRWLQALYDSGRLYHRALLGTPYLQPLASSEEFQNIRKQSLQRVNEERAKLGWEPVEDVGLKTTTLPEKSS